jgi:23S rRNA (uridine2552-2'-O)-methyltransferase
MYDRKDALYRRAKREGYRSRAAYKLLELEKRTRILRPGHAVVDLGAWPGGWLQVAAEIVGASGRVVGVDLVTIDPLPASQIVVLRGDVTDAGCIAAVCEALGRPADVVLADLAPKLSGIRPRDEARASELAQAAHDFAIATLATGGALVMKTLGGATGENTRRTLRERFSTVRQLGLDATRKGSSELYLVASGFRGRISD